MKRIMHLILKHSKTFLFGFIAPALPNDHAEFDIIKDFATVVLVVGI